jgi:hypothetical protein
VTEAKEIGGTRGTFDVLVEFSRANVRAIFGFTRRAAGEPWKLSSLKITLPMPRSDDVIVPGPINSGSARGSAPVPKQ